MCAAPNERGILRVRPDWPSVDHIIVPMSRATVKVLDSEDIPSLIGLERCTTKLPAIVCTCGRYLIYKES